MSSAEGMNFCGRYMRVALIGCLALFPLTNASDLHAQLVDEFTMSNVVKPSSLQQNRTTVVKIRVKDSTLRFVLHEIAKVSGQQVVFSGNIPQLSQKVSLTLNEPNALAAVRAAIKNTGLTAAVAKDGKTIVVVSQGKVQDTSVTKGEGIVRGRVLDSATGNAISGATVSIQAHKLSAVTNNIGLFVLEGVPLGNQKVSVRAFGFGQTSESVTVTESEDVSLSFRLRQLATSLNEVVTTAVGKQRRVEVGNDIVKLNVAEILERAPARSVSDLLRFAQVPGVRVMTASGDPGAPTKIQMRGIGSISQSTDPAIIVDGVWIDSRMSDSSIVNRAQNIGRTAYNSSPIDNIDPATIESFEIIRGPSAASMYGQEAANGVIVITTKRGREGPASWRYEFSRDWDSQVRARHGNWYGFGTNPGGFTEECSAAQHYRQTCFQDSVVDLNRYGSLRDDIAAGHLSKNTLSVSGGSGRITYAFSGTYDDERGTRRTTPFTEIGARMLNIPLSREYIYPDRLRSLFLSSNLGFSLARSLTMDLSVRSTNSNQQRNQVIMGGTRFLDLAIDTTVVGGDVPSFDIITGGSNRHDITSSVNLQYRPDSWWNAQGTIGANVTDGRNHAKNDYRRCNTGICAPDIQERSYPLNNESVSNRVLSGRFVVGGILPTKFDRFLSLSPSIGLDVKRSTSRRSLVRVHDVPFGADQGSGSGIGSINANDIITAGYFVNTTIGLFERMYFNLGFRQDAGSVIRDNSVSQYPKLSTSWLVSDEGFFPKNTFLSAFSLRGAIGYAAVHPDAADIKGGYLYRQAIIDEQIIWIADIGSIGNSRLLPERSMEVEVGFDAYMWEDRTVLRFTVADKNLKNAIITRNLPPSSGKPIAPTRKENISHVQNRSIEVDLDTRVIDNDWMMLQLRGSFGNTNNVIRKLGNNVLIAGNTSTNRLVEGYQIGAVWERPVLGYGDTNGDGLIDNNEIILGDTTVYKGWNNPKYTLGYGGTLSILNRDLSFSFDLSQRGPHTQNARYQDNYGGVVVGAPLDRQALSLFSSGQSQYTGGASMTISEIRLNSASINYTLPRRFSGRLKVNLVQISLQGSNLGLWTSYSGRDPLVNSTPIGNMISDDGFTLPLPRKYAFNVIIGF